MAVPDDRRARLARERAAADDLYNSRLTTVDQALPVVVEPPVVPPVDAAALPAVNDAWRILPEPAPVIDRSIKGRLRGFIWRLIGPPLTAQHHFNASVVDHLNRTAESARQQHAALAAALEQLRAHSHAQRAFQESLIHLAQSVTAYVDTRDRAMSVVVEDELAPQISAVRQALLALTRSTPNGGQPLGAAEPAGLTARPPDEQATAAALYVGFEDRFRGTQEDIRARVTDYVALFAGATNVLDVGCGRGEVLQLFKEAGVTARGIDLNPSMIDVCRARGLDARVADAVGYLHAQPDGSLGGVLAIQVVEHLEAAYLSRFLALAFHKLAPGALLVLETINPTCWVAFFESYIRDMTHRWPLHPETLRFLVEAHGFAEVGVQFRSPVTPTGQLPRVPDAATASHDAALAAALAPVITTLNAHADQLNARMFSHMDYAVIARR